MNESLAHTAHKRATRSLPAFVLFLLSSPVTACGWPHTHNNTMAASKAVDITFSNLWVHVTDQRTKQRKTLIHGVSGGARSGRLLAIMGGSGAGKSTLVSTASLTRPPTGA